MRVDLTQIQVRAVVTMLRGSLGEEPDDQLLLDMLEGETDLMEISRRILNAIEEEEGSRAVLTDQMDARKLRRDRCDARIKAHREAIAALMDAASLDKLPLPEATVTLRKNQPKRIVNDLERLPDEYCTFTRKPDLAAIKEAGDIPGTTLDNGSISLTIRRK